MNVLLYLINSTQLLLLFLNGRTGRQPHDDDDDDVLLAQVLLYRYDKARRGGQLIRKGHHSPATLLRISRRSVYPYLPRRWYLTLLSAAI